MSCAPDPEAFLLAESIPPAQLVGHRVWVQGFGAGLVEKFEKAWVGFGTSTHTVRFDSGQTEKVKLRRHGNGKTPFILLTAPNAIARPAKTVFRYVVDEGSESGSEPVTPSEASAVAPNLIPGATEGCAEPMAVAPGSLVEHLEGQAWNMCARIADPQNPAYASSALSESLSESPSYAFSCTPPESQRMTTDLSIPQEASDDTGPTSGPMDIPQGCDDGGICRVDHLLSESGTIFTPGEHKWILEASPPQNEAFLSMFHAGPPGQTVGER